MAVDKGNAVDVTEIEQKIIQAAYDIQMLLEERQLGRIEAKAAAKLVWEVLSWKE